MNERKGYTLIELITVLALISILFMVSIPNSYILVRHREYNEIKQFEKDLKFARAKAMVENSPVEFMVDVQQNKYKIVQNNKVIKEYIFKNGVQLQSITISDNKSSQNWSSIVFKTTGAPSSAGTINFNTKNFGNYSITIEVATGRINTYINR